MILLWLLGIEYAMILIPLIILTSFLVKHYKENGEISKLRKILIYVSIAKILYFIGNIWTVYISLTGGQTQTDCVIAVFAVTTTLLCLADWYALYIIYHIQHNK